MAAIVQSERAELIEALMHMNREAMRLPRHFVERKAKLHGQMDEILTLLELIASDNGSRTDLDDVIVQFGFDPAELRAEVAAEGNDA